MAFSIDSIIKSAIANLDESMLHRDQKKRKRHHPLQGYCYVVAEAILHLRCDRSNYRPMRVKHEGQSHWFLQHQGDGHVIDPTAGQFKTNIPYHKAKRAAFLTSRPSARTRPLLRRMYKWLIDHGCLEHVKYEIDVLCATQDDWLPSIPGGYCRVTLTLNHPFLRTTFHRVSVTGTTDADVGLYKQFYDAEGAGQALALFESLRDLPHVNQDYLKDLGFFKR